MKKITGIFLLSSTLLTIADAATINWSFSAITGYASDVVTNGTLVEAVNGVGNGVTTSPTINGVTFTADGTLLADSWTGDPWTGPASDSDYDQLLSTIDYEGSGTGAVTLKTFSGLTVGEDYLIQVWHGDSSWQAPTPDRTMTYAGTGQNVLNGESYAIGTFTADATTQDLVVTASQNGPRLTGYQLRSVPETVPGDAITLEDLLNQMVDRSVIARFPKTSTRLINFSSYNRASDVGPPESGVSDTASGWFANGDFNGKYLYTTEEYGNGTEYVMVDHEAPGALVRFWTPWRSITSPTLNDYIRIYLDGSSTPVMEGNLLTLFDGTGLIPYPLAHPSLRSGVSFFPIPYAERCVVTLDRSPFFYIFTHREYDEGTEVETFTMEAFNAASNLTAQVGQALLDPAANLPPTNVSWQGTLASNAEVVLNLPAGTNAVHEFTVVLDENSRGNRLMRSVIVKAEFDGQETIWCPLSDFFGSGVGLHPFEGWFRTVESNGTLSCRWVMPYQASATITLENLYDEPVELSMSAATEPWEWDEQSLYFHSGWRFQSPLPTRPWSDWNYITLTGGRGVFVGDTLTLWNPVTGWWGEGDHKIWVDGEDFPSMFGTGTEDYYAYSWGGRSTDFYDHPFHAQVRCHVYDQLNRHPDSPGYTANTQGYSTETRTRALDTIVFTNSLQLDMEVWHGTDTEVEYAVANHWYSDLSQSNSLSPDPVSATLPVRVSDEPELSLSTGSLDFGTVFVGKTKDLTVTVENSGAGTLSGSASVAPPFSIVSGSNYVLTAFQQQNVVVRYTPTAAGSDTGTVVFAGTLGTNVTVSGTAAVFSGTIIADVAYDYTTAPGYGAGSTAPTTPPTGWEYLYSSAASGGTEVALTPRNPVGNAGNRGFEGPAANNTPAVLGGIAGGSEFEIFSDGQAFNAGVVGDDILLHPGNSAATRFVIVRYTISAADMLNGTTASISGNFRRGNSVDNGGISASVYYNTVSIWTVDSTASGGTDLPREDGAFVLTGLTVAEGDTISFVLDSNGNYGGDETALTGMVVIESPEDPPEILPGVVVTNGNIGFQFSGSTGQHYRVESTDHLTNLVWQTVLDYNPLLTSPLHVAIPATNPAAFYRVVNP
ncbi:DUF2961 domain-containing protein [Pontiellaceae bacterium B1224]|nr:DUF2961 domain-containing protein [Pontiellaceae bacterium B1224]